MSEKIITFNPIRLSAFELMEYKRNLLHFDGADLLNGASLPNSRPLNTTFDHAEPIHNGWQGDIDGVTAKHRGLREFRSGSEA